MSARQRSLGRTVTGLALFAALSAVLSTVVVASLLNLDLTPSHTYHAIFVNASDLQSGDPVRIAGVEVGRVVGVRLHGTHAAEVTFTVNSGQRLRASTGADIQFENLFGERSLTLVAGPPAPPLRPGSVIPATRTQPALDLSDLFNGFQPLFQALTPSQVNQLTGNIIGTFQGQSGSLAALVSEAGALTNNLADHQQVIDSVVNNLTSLLQVVGGHSRQLALLVDNFDTLAGRLSGERSQIGSAIQGADGLVTSLSNVTGSLQAPLESDIRSLSSVAGAMAAHQTAITGAIDSLPPLFTHAARTVQNGAFVSVYYCSLAITIKTPVPLLPDPVQSAVDKFLEDLGDPPIPLLGGVVSPNGQEGNPNAHTPTCAP